MRHKKLWLIGMGMAGGAALTRWQMARWFTEEPSYELEERLGALEIRHYHRIVRAETTVEGLAWDAALNEGFKRLAGYIFGANRPRQTSDSLEEGERLAMTTPVGAQSQKIAMTAPVGVRPESLPGAEAPAFTVTFTLPRERISGPVPVPEDARVKLRSLPPRRVAALRYSGRHDARRVAEKSRALLEAVQRAGFQPRGEPEFAGYDPPTTLPWLRRNEVWVELVAPPSPFSISSFPAMRS
jgi:hypothetical protein